MSDKHCVLGKFTEIFEERVINKLIWYYGQKVFFPPILKLLMSAGFEILYVCVHRYSKNEFYSLNINPFDINKYFYGEIKFEFTNKKKNSKY